MNLPDALSHLIAHRARWLHAATAALLATAGLAIAFHMHFASDVLDMLPQHFESVQIFKIYDQQFSQARELTFALHDESKRCDLDAFAEHFGEELRKEPWIVRVVDAPPGDAEGDLKEAHKMFVPMLVLNMPEADFDKAMGALDPKAIDQRLSDLRSQMESGSPMAMMQLGNDPLGIVAPASKPLRGSSFLDQSRPFVSPDETLHLVFATTNQKDLGVHACQETMRRFEDFKKRLLANWEGDKPEILVTGRTPYVAELSEMMRLDVVTTLITTVLLVSAVFWIGFRRLRPLAAIMHVLLVCCVVAVALGAFVFHELNMITIGLCSILIGLGVDFGMMLYSIYEAERAAGHDHQTAIRAALQSQGRGVSFGAMTSAAAFISLARSQCPGFVQLGVLIAFGIVFAGLFMMTLFFAAIGGKHVPKANDRLRAGGTRFVTWVFAHPKPIFCTTAGLLLVLTAIAAAPIGELKFEANPKSLEPKNSAAGHALRTITEKMPSVGEPWLVLVHGRDAQDLHDRWEKLQTSWSALMAEGALKTVATPAAFVISPQRVQANAAKLTAAGLTAARDALAAAMDREGLKREGFTSTFALIDALIAANQGNWQALDWRNSITDHSNWHFVVDRFFGADPMVTVGYVTPAKKITSYEEKEKLRQALDVPGVGAQFSGWTYTLADLVPWAKSKLVEMSVIMIVFNIILLIFLYRKAFPLFALMVSLVLSVGAMIASLKLIGASLNLFNVLAFPLVLGVGVDYGIYVVIAMRAKENVQRSTAMIIKPVLLSGLTAVAGFGSLALAQNPALRGLGVVCAFGIGWCLFATFLFIVPLYAWRGAD